MAFDMRLPFDSDDPAFARGVEVGIVRQRLESETLPVSAIMHVANAEMIFRLAEAVGASASADDLGHDWLAVEFR